MKTFTIATIAGDGVGTEVIPQGKRVLEKIAKKYDVTFAFQDFDWGAEHFFRWGRMMPAGAIDLLQPCDAIYLGAVGHPQIPDHTTLNGLLLPIRRAFDLYANVRPARTIIPGRFNDIDLVLVRENLEGLYVGFEHYIPVGDDPRAVAVGSGVNTRAGSRRIAEFAFDYAVRNGRKKVTIVHKANVLKALTGLFLDAAKDVAKRYEGRIATEERIVDACAMQLVMNPWQFDVIVTTNLFGDILSDEIAGLVGGLGMAPAANIGVDAAIFEAVHGSAPDIAGRGVANPLALMLTAAMMLDHVGEQEKGRRLRAAIDGTLRVDGVRTGDMGGRASTKDFTRAVAARLA